VSDRQARVRVDDETWREFRNELGDTSVAVYLGRMVEVDVGRHRARRLQNDRTTPVDFLAALDRARALRDELFALVDRLEKRIERGW